MACKSNVAEILTIEASKTNLKSNVGSENKLAKTSFAKIAYFLAMKFVIGHFQRATKHQTCPTRLKVVYLKFWPNAKVRRYCN